MFVAIAKGERSREAFALAQSLRATGVPVQIEQAGRSMKGQFKHAGRIGARWTVIVGEAIEAKDMQTGEQTEVSGAREAIELITR